jgi:dTDP-4-dehydrorhamnose reductase
MKILILGGNGMIGHKMYQFIANKYVETWVTLRKDFASYEYNSIYDKTKVIDNFDLSNFENINEELNKLMPNVIINASGITIRRGVETCISNTVKINSALPHFLNEWVIKNNKRLIHFSTDCVFSGHKGDYLENDISDAYDIYGQSKALGEVNNSSNTLTLRGSMIGRELENKTELLEWFLLQTNESILGYSKVIYSGITTIKMAEIVLVLLEKFPMLSGVFNVSSVPLSKFELLNLFEKEFKIGSNIISDDSKVSNKNLLSDKFFSSTNISIPNWNNMIIQLREDCISNNLLYL